MTREEFKEKAKEVIDKEQFGSLGVLFNYESFEEMKVAQIPDSLDSATSDMPLDDFLDKLYEQIKQDSILDKIRTEIMDFEEELFHRPNTDYTDYAAVRHCVEILDKYKAGSEK